MLNKIRTRIRALFFKPTLENELNDELHFHLEREIEENIARGMKPEEARYAALRSFGGVERIKEESRDTRGVHFIEELLQDLHYGTRMLFTAPGFTIVAVLALGLGIGANSAIFSFVNVVLLEPLPYTEPERLVHITELKQIKHEEGKWGTEDIGSVDFILWREKAKLFDHLVAFNSRNVAMTGRGEPEKLYSIWATANLFSALGVSPQIGRGFTLEEDRPGGARVVILSHSLWERRFGSDPAIIGKSVTLDKESRQIIGVMPFSFKFIEKVDVVLPLAINLQLELTRNVDGVRYLLDNMIGRLKPGVSVEQARSELDSLLVYGKQLNPKLGYMDKVIVTPLSEKLFGHLRSGYLLLFGTVAFILLIACANVANLILARSQVRQKEMAIRAAIGASRRRLVRQILTESLLLSFCGGVVGLLLAVLSVRSLAPLIPPDLTHLKETGVATVAVGFTFFTSLLASVIAGIIPAFHTSQIDLNDRLKEGARDIVSFNGRNARQVSLSLVIGELAITLVLLIGAGLLIKSFIRVSSVEPGYDQENLLTMSIPLSRAKYTPEQKKIFYKDLLTRIKSLPGVKAAGVGPLPAGAGMRPGTELEMSRYITSTDYFQAMGVQLRAGRVFTEQDNEKASPVIVVNETLARRQFPGQDPIGKYIRYDEDRQIDGVIIGVVADVKRFGLEAEVQADEYHSILQNGIKGDLSLAVRTTGDPLKFAPVIRKEIWAIDKNLLVLNVGSMEHLLAESLAPRRFQMMLFGAFALIAMVLAVVGIYGVMSYWVERRNHEIGLRMALGARSGDVMRMIVRQGLTLILIGVVIGLAVAGVMTNLMSSMLFGVRATDPTTFIVISLLLIAVALLACWIPARRATKVDPIIALRCE